MTILQPNHKRAKRDFLETPLPLCEWALQICLPPLTPAYPTSGITEMPVVLDAGAGTGHWGKAARSVVGASIICGVDDDPKRKRVSGYDTWYTQDFQTFELNKGNYSAVVGNPPFRLAEEFIRHSLELVKPRGCVLFLLRLAFLESAKRENDLWFHFPPKHVWVLAERIPWGNHPKGKQGKTDDTAYAMYLWEKGWRGTPKLHWLAWRRYAKLQKENQDKAQIHPPNRKRRQTKSHR